MLITISGLDGSGKTTQSYLLKDYFEGKNFKVIYQHKIKESLPNKLMNIINESVGKREGIKKNLSVMDKKIRYLAFIFDLFHFKLRKNKMMRGKDILISDRYFFDTIVNLQYLDVLDINTKSYFYDKIPRPNLSFFLEVPPQEAYKRKKEHTKDYYIKKVKLYNNFFKNSPVNVIPRDSIAQTHNRIVEIVNSELEKKR